MPQRLKKLLFVSTDFFFYFISLIVMLLFWRGRNLDLEIFFRHLVPFSFLLPFWFISFFIEGLYSFYFPHWRSLIGSFFRASGLGLGASYLFFYFFNFSGITPKTNLFIFAISFSFFSFFIRLLLLQFFKSSNFLIPTLIAGPKSLTHSIKSHLENFPLLGFLPILFFNEKEPPSKDFSLSSFCLENKIGAVLFDWKTIQEWGFEKDFFSLHSQGVRIYDLGQFSETALGKLPIESLDRRWYFELSDNHFLKSFSLIKTLLDFLFSVILLLFFAPIFLFLIPLMLFSQGWPLFFRQTRMGKFNQPFTLVKLRTMIQDAERAGAQWAKPDDPRVTAIGRFLRKTRIDEFPQLINILKGDMSLVGPRPERPEFVSVLAEKIPFYNERSLVKPGLTGWAQINFGYGHSEEHSHEKLQYDLYYVKNQSIILDLSILLKTVKTVLTGAGH